jgi:LAGLIDADG endonuclease
LYAIHQFFGVGIVNERANEGLCVYRVTSVTDLVNVIIPHFMLYSLCTCKQADFMLWQVVVNMMANGLHLTTEGFNTILTYYASINKRISRTVLNYFPNIVPVLRPEVILPLILNPFWISGFAAGDGNFSVGIRSTGQIYFNFNIAQHIRDFLLMNLIISFFECGNVYSRINRADFIVQNFDNIFDIIIPHFINYPLYNIKTLDFNDFKKAANLFKVGGRDNTDKIAKLIANMNSRRTSKSDDSDSKK